MEIRPKHIDNGFYQITAREASYLAKQSTLGRLPRVGHESIVVFNDRKCWLARTNNWGKTVWSIRLAEHTPPQYGTDWQGRYGLYETTILGEKVFYRY
jgi:hypothetical protein